MEVAVRTLLVREGAACVIRALAYPTPPTLPDPCPTLKFITDLWKDNPAEWGKLARLLQRTADDGPVANTEKFKYLTGTTDIHEFKTGGGVRILCFFDGANLILCTHGFDKKSRKTPKTEITKAEDDRSLYFSAKKHQTLQHGPTLK